MTAMRRPCPAAAALLLALTVLPAAAQYKVVGPDGRVTYTDRPPADAAARVTDLRRVGGAPAAAPGAGTASALPADLQRLSERFPVTLFSAGADCVPCNDGRALLRQRGRRDSRG
jgi:hypothetical protein